MKEYLKKYKELVKQLEINKNKIQENKLLVDENYRKREENKDQLDKLKLEISELNEEYNNLMNKKENEFFNKVKVIVTLLAIVVFILLTMFNAVFILLAPPLLVAISGIIYLIIFIISKCTSIFENKFKKDKDITKLLERINKKENELSNIKTICDEYSLNIIKYQFELEHLNNENLNINNSINKLLTDYATPIFDKQLKTYTRRIKRKIVNKN